MTKTFEFCPEECRTVYELKERLDALLRAMALATSDAWIQRVSISRLQTQYFCHDGDVMRIIVDYGIDKPTEIAFENRFYSTNRVAEVVNREFSKFALQRLEYLQNSRHSIPV